MITPIKNCLHLVKNETVIREEHERTLIAISQSYHNLQQRKNRNNIEEEDYQIGIAKVALSLLETMQVIENELTKKEKRNYID